MREIIFRGKSLSDFEDVKKGDWVYGVPIIFDGKYFIINSVGDISENCLIADCWYRVDPETIGQFTGWYDANEKKIFEGDVARYYRLGRDGHAKLDYFIYKIVYRESVSTFRTENIAENVPFSATVFAPIDKKLAKQYEVIGNIYDKPEK